MLSSYNRTAVTRLMFLKCLFDDAGGHIQPECLCDEIVSCYKDPAELVLFHSIEMMGHIWEESVSFCNQFRHQLTRLCVMTEGGTLARPKGHQVSSFLRGCRRCDRLGEGVLKRKWQWRTGDIAKFIH